MRDRESSSSDDVEDASSTSAGADDESSAGADDESSAGADDESSAGADDESSAGADDTAARESFQPSDSMRERVPGSTWRLWVLLDAGRWWLALAISACVFASLVAIGLFQSVDVVTLLRSGDPVETAFQAFVGAIITGVTLVLTLNQLVLSQELGAVGDQRERMEAATAFRRDVADVVDPSTAPEEPSAFLRALVVASADRAVDLADSVADAADAGEASEAFDAAVTAYTESAVANANAVADALEGAEFGTFDVVSAALDYNYSWKLYRARRLRRSYAGEITPAVEVAFDDLERTFELFAPAREHVKTLYFRWALVDLSRAILYAAVPALVTATGMLFFFDPSTQAVTGTTAGVPTALLVVAGASTVSLLPFTILLAYVLRIATVAKRTLSIGAFVLRETDRDGTGSGRAVDAEE
jgi:hypothetical protein